MVLASSNFGFYLGLAIGFGIVVVVVAVVAVLLTFASRIADQAGTAAGALEQVRANTAALPEAETTNEHALAILGAAKAARGALTG